MRKCECGNQVANNARTCPHCGHRFTSGFVKFIGWCFGIFIGLVVFGVIISNFSASTSTPRPVSNRTSVPAPGPANAAAGNITEAERNYLGAAASYLKTGNDEGMRVARAMAGASDGSSTLGDIRAAISSAKRIENAGYQGDYKDRIKGNIPNSVADLSTNVEETHRRFQAALNELLEYWSDQNTAHISSGSDALQSCVKLMNATITQTTEKMKQLAAQ